MLLGKLWAELKTGDLANSSWPPDGKGNQAFSVSVRLFSTTSLEHIIAASWAAKPRNSIGWMNIILQV